MSTLRVFNYRISSRFPKRYAELVTDPERHLGDGGYARVVDLEPGWVLKLTCCKATQVLLEELYRLGQQRRTPHQLPMVRECLGIAARDQDGMVHKGYVVERLFSRPLTATAARVRLALYDAVAALRGWNLPQCARLEPRPALAARQLRDDFRSFTSAGSDEEGGWARSVQALQNAATVLGADALDAMLLLERLAAHRPTEVDVCSTGNIMFSAWGFPILADPVASPARPTLHKRPTNRGIAVVGELFRSTAQDLINLPRYWTVGRYATMAEARKAKVEVEADRQYVSARLMRWWSPEHLATIGCR